MLGKAEQSDEANLLDEEGRAPLHYAAWNGLATPLGLLLAHPSTEVDVLSGDRRSSPLHLAAGMGHLECVKLLLAHGASKRCKDVDNWTPSCLAAQNINDSASWEEIVELCRAASPKATRRDKT